MESNSSPGVGENEAISAIPPVISSNPREIIEAEEIPIEDVLKHCKNEAKLTEDVSPNIVCEKPRKPIPLYPISIVWSPSVLYLDIDESFIKQKIKIWNICSRTIYIACCGLWGETARLGAKWRCFPRTRYLLAPGLTADLFIQATPREQCPVPSAQIAIQLAAAHKRDSVVGYFIIPIVVKFQKYIEPCLGEEETLEVGIVTK